MPDRLFYTITLGFILGIAIESFFSVPASMLTVFVFVSVILLFVSFLFKSLREIFVVSSLLSVSVFFGILRFQFYEHNHYFKNLDSYLDERIEIFGTIVDEPDRRESNQKILIKTKEVAGESLESNILVTTDLYPVFKYGDRVSVSGVLRSPTNFETEQGNTFDYISYLAKDNIFYLIQKGQVEVVDHDAPSVLQEKLFEFKNRIIKNIENVIPAPASTFMSGITLGARSGLPSNIRDEFIKTGTIHIVALSGYNISVVANGIQKFFTLFLSRYGALSFGGLSIVLFVLMSGASSTAIRAGIMAILVIMARFSGKTYDINRGLVLAALLMVFANPKTLIFDISFQLSFLATIGIIYITPITETWFYFINKKRFGWFKEIVSSTIAAQIATLPFIVYTMGNLSLISFPINILILPFIPLAMYLGFLVGALGFIGQFIAYPFGLVSTLILNTILSVISLGARLPLASVYINNVPFWIVFFIYVLMSYFVYRWHINRKSVF